MTASSLNKHFKVLVKNNLEQFKLMIYFKEYIVHYKIISTIAIENVLCYDLVLTFEFKFKYNIGIV